MSGLLTGIGEGNGSMSMSAAVNTATTPGASRAPAVSTPVIRARAITDRT